MNTLVETAMQLQLTSYTTSTVGSFVSIFVLYLEEGVHCTSLELSQYFGDNHCEGSGQLFVISWQHTAF